jgi:hypothetical protein
MTQTPADAPVAWPVTPEMIAAGWDCLKRPNVRSMPTLGPGMGLKEAYLAMRALEPRQAPAPRQDEQRELTHEEASLVHGAFELSHPVQYEIAPAPIHPQKSRRDE